MRRAILARHGESAYSARGALNGDITVSCPLTPRGVLQARRLGEALRSEPIELCVTSEFERTRQTAGEALHGRAVPCLVLPELNDPRYGSFEGALLEEYRRWASGASSSEAPGELGESRLAILDRYTRGFRVLLARPEDTILVVAHSLPVAYALGARDGIEPGARMPLAEHARPHELTAEELRRATELLERWVAAPTW